MWVHIVIFILILVVVILWKINLLPQIRLLDGNGKKLFVLIALSGNILGLLVTLQNGIPEVYVDGHRLLKKESGTYEEEFLLKEEGEEARNFYVQVPAKDTEQEESPAEETLTEEEKDEKRIRDAIALYNQKKNDPDYYYLPARIDGKRLEWSGIADNSGSLIAALGILAAFVMIFRKEQEIQEKQKKRTEQLMMDYPGLIMKFTLLVQAGMTVRRAFQKMALDYKRKRKMTENIRFAYEEILVTCNEMESGISELEAYRRFGERCGQIKYKTFATLLIQNLQKGSKRMSDMLEKESMEAWDERKRKARVLGEMAATKLLFPMILMMVVVMAIIMIPAFLAFYG